LLLAGMIPAVATIAIGLKLARTGRFRVVMVRSDTRSPWLQPPRLGLTQTEVRVVRPAAPRIERPLTIARRQHQRDTVHPRPRRTRKKPSHY
jgi:hypothetical protein